MFGRTGSSTPSSTKICWPFAGAAGRYEIFARWTSGTNRASSATYVVTPATGAASVSVYDDKSGADESTRVAGEWLRENVPDVAGSPPEVSSGEVIIDL